MNRTWEAVPMVPLNGDRHAEWCHTVWDQEVLVSGTVCTLGCHMHLNYLKHMGISYPNSFGNKPLPNPLPNQDLQGNV